MDEVIDQPITQDEPIQEEPQDDTGVVKSHKRVYKKKPGRKPGSTKAVLEEKRMRQLAYEEYLRNQSGGHPGAPTPTNTRVNTSVEEEHFAPDSVNAESSDDDDDADVIMFNPQPKEIKRTKHKHQDASAEMMQMLLSEIGALKKQVTQLPSSLPTQLPSSLPRSGAFTTPPPAQPKKRAPRTVAPKTKENPKEPIKKVQVSHNQMLLDMYKWALEQRELQKS